MKTTTILIILPLVLATGSSFAFGQKHPVAKAQKVTITVDHGFKPASVNVKAGQPVEITFDVKHKDCASTVFFKDLKITTKLTDGKKTVVKFTPKAKGTISYACSMNMLKGQVIAK